MGLDRASDFDSALNRATGLKSDYHIEVDELPAAKRFGTWHDSLCETFYPFDMTGPTDFGIGRLVIKDVGDVRAGMIKSDPITVERGRGHMSQRGGDFIYISMPLNTPVTLEQRGRETVVRPGEMAFVVTADRYRYHQPMQLDQNTLRIPTSVVRERFPGVEDLSARTMSRRQAPVALFLDYASGFCSNASGLEGPDAAIASNFLVELFAFALTSGAGPDAVRDTSVKIAHMRRAVHYIEAHLDDPDLGVSQIAQAVNVSERYLQRLFAERGDTVTGFVRSRRVQEAKRLLKDRACRAQTIASIGYRVGFTDPSHFSRLFREAVGVSPRDFRTT